MKTIQTILSAILTPPRLRYFDGEAAPAPAAAPVAAPEVSPADASVIDYVPEDISGDFLSKEPPAPPPAAPPAAPPATPPPAPAGKDKPPGEGVAGQLRTELNAVKLERDELKERLGKEDPRVKALDEEVKAAAGKLAAADKRLKEYETKLALADPAVTEKLRVMDSDFDTKAGRFYESVPEMNADAVTQLAREYHKLPFNTPEYKDALAAFEAKVNAELGGDETTESRKLDKALGFIQDFRQYSLDRNRTQKEVQDSALKLKRDSEVQKFTGERTWISKALAEADKLPEGMAETSPFHPRVMLANFKQQMPPETVAAVSKGIPEYINLVLAGPKPSTEEDYAGLSEQQIQEFEAEKQQKYTSARRTAVDVMHNGLLALRIVPSMMKEIARLKDMLKQAPTAPPDPTKPGDAKPGEDDIAAYEPDPVPTHFNG